MKIYAHLQEIIANNFTDIIKNAMELKIMQEKTAGKLILHFICVVIFDMNKKVTKF
jgi:hypothetical protein